MRLTRLLGVLAFTMLAISARADLRIIPFVQSIDNGSGDMLVRTE